MRQYPKLRTAAKWGGLGLAVLCGLAWACSLFSIVGWITPGGWVWALRRGKVTLKWRSSTDRAWGLEGAPLAPGPILRRTRYAATDWRIVWRPGTGEGDAAVPLWAPVAVGLLVGVPALALERRARRRVLAGHCSTCDYDRSTLPPAAPCPECGAEAR